MVATLIEKAKIEVPDMQVEEIDDGMDWATGIFLEVMAVAAAFGWGVAAPGSTRRRPSVGAT